jgi:hypothetical protein
MNSFMRLTAVGLLLSSSLVAAGEVPELRWKFASGQVHNYRFKHREVRAVEINDQKAETTTETSCQWKWTVKEVDDKGIATLEQKLTALRVTCNGKDFDFAHEAGKPKTDGDDYQKQFANLFDQLRLFEGCKVRLAPDGRVVEVRGLSKLLQENDPGMNILDLHFLNWRDDGFAWFLQQALGRLPENGKAATGVWKVQVAGMLADLGPFQGQVDFTLKKPVREDSRLLQEIAFKGAQQTDLDMKWIGLAVRGKLATTKLAGSIRFDARAGTLDSSRAQIDMKGDLQLGDDATPFRVSYQHTLELHAVHKR